MPKPSLYDYQEEDLGKARVAFRHFRRVLFQAPTGYGKTRCFTNICWTSYHKGYRVVVNAHLKIILKQISERFNEFGIPHGWITSDRGGSDHLIQLAMEKTYERRLQNYPPPRFLIKDEAHHMRAATNEAIARNLPEEVKYLGFTATPDRPDGKSLTTMFDCLVTSRQVKFLIEINKKCDTMGLVQPLLFHPPSDFDRKAIKKKGSKDFDLTAAAEEGRKTLYGNAVEHYKEYCPGVGNLVFCCTIEQAIEVAELYRAAGFSATHIDGTMSDYERDSKLNGFKNGSIQVLTSVNLFLEGVDVPGAVAATWLRPTQSVVVWDQGNGRVMRPARGKKACIIFDHAGNCWEDGLGAPDRDRYYNFDGMEGLRAKSQGGGSSGLVRCEKCHFCFEAGPDHCPHCGAALPAKVTKIVEVAGQLLIGSEEAEILEAMRRAQFQEKQRKGLARCRNELDCIALAIELGKDEGYGKHLWLRKLHAIKGAAAI